MPSFNPVNALERGLAVLTVVNKLQRAKVADVHAQTGLDKATVIRMLETLIHAGYVVKNSKEAIYFPSARTMELSCGFNLRERITETAGPIHSQFHRAVGWPSDVAIRDGDAMVLVHSSNEDGILQFNRPAGFRGPMLMTCLGLAYLAFCHKPEQDRIIANLSEIPGPDTEPARDRAKLDGLLAKIRSQGYALNDPTYAERVYSKNTWAIGVPIKDSNNIYAVLSMILLTSSFSRTSGVQKYLRTMQGVADRLAIVFAEEGFNISASELFR